MKQFTVTGMSCAACQVRVEKAVSGVEGVSSCSVSLLTNSMGVEGMADEHAIIKAVEDAGYGASIKNSISHTVAPNYEEELIDRETPAIFKRLIASLIFLIPLMYVSMGAMMWNFPLPDFFAKNHLAIGIYELLMTSIILVINQKFFISGWKGVIHKSPNMDTLVALGASASYLYSVYALFAMSDAYVHADAMKAMQYMDEFYFESAAMILTLITVGKLLEAKSKGKTTDALKSLMRLAPKRATIIVDGVTKEVSIEEVGVGTHFVVRAGDSIPVDGKVIGGEGAVNEASLTGESIPVDKVIGDEVYAATINQSGYMECVATRVGEDTSLSRIIQMVSDAAATKAPIAQIADRVSGIFVPTVIGIAVLTFLVWIVAGREFGFALARSISVLVISCPCSLGLATPVAIMVGNGVGAKHGVLFKTASSLEETGRADIVVLDKTGTITKGEPEVESIHPADNVLEQELLQIAYSLEIKSEHPLARAINNKAIEHALVATDTQDFKTHSGHGVSATIDGVEYVAGNQSFVQQYVKMDEHIVMRAKEKSEQGVTPIYFAQKDRLLGMIGVADSIKEDSTLAISQLKNMGIFVAMLTGDNTKTAKAIGRRVGVDQVIAQVLPNEKADIISRLKQYGKVVMVGDGINDAPALTAADIGIAIGTGTDVAMDAAQVVVMKSSLMDVASAIRLSKKTLRTIYENLFWAFFYNCLGIPLAAGVGVILFGWTLNPMFGAAAMSLSSFCVVTNALKINLFHPYQERLDRRVKSKVSVEGLMEELEIKKGKEEEKMEIIVKGMMCKHCEAHTKEAIEKLEGVVSATADHTTETVVIETNAAVSEEAVKAAVEAAGYEYCGLK